MKHPESFQYTFEGKSFNGIATKEPGRIQLSLTDYRRSESFTFHICDEEMLNNVH